MPILDAAGVYLRAGSEFLDTGLHIQVSQRATCHRRSFQHPVLYTAHLTLPHGTIVWLKNTALVLQFAGARRAQVNSFCWPANKNNLSHSTVHPRQMHYTARCQW